jgi:hypothetical protein
MLSEANYQKLIHKNNSLFQAIQQWRDDLTNDVALTEVELKNIRTSSQERVFSWGE